MARASMVRLLTEHPSKAAHVGARRMASAFAGLQACETDMSGLACLWRLKDGRGRSSTVKKQGKTADRRLVHLKTVLYGHMLSLYGTVPCLTALSRIILSWAAEDSHQSRIRNTNYYGWRNEVEETIQ